MKYFSGLAVGACILCAAGCASQGQVQQVESTSEANQKILRENEYRLHNIENSITALNTQVAQLNNRVYEVRTKSGQKTSMTVVPIVAANTAQNSGPGHTVPVSGGSGAPAAPAQKAPAGRKIDPSAKPAALPVQAVAAKTPARSAKRAVNAGASGSIGQPEAVAGPSGQIAAARHDIGLPPAELPENATSGLSQQPAASASRLNAQAAIPTPAGNAEQVPVPPIPDIGISLPPEHPDLPPVAIQAPNNASAPPSADASVTEQAQAPQTRSTLAKGEDAAYKAALNAARSGHTEQGIKLFRDFQQQYPNSKYAANADYWIGECLYSQKKYQDALSQFQAVNNSYPKHHKNADALLKAGMTLSRLGDRAGAAEKFRTLISTFPNSDAARRARAMGAAH